MKQTGRNVEQEYRGSLKISRASSRLLKFHYNGRHPLICSCFWPFDSGTKCQPHVCNYPHIHTLSHIKKNKGQAIAVTTLPILIVPVASTLQLVSFWLIADLEAIAALKATTHCAVGVVTITIWQLAMWLVARVST